MTPRPVLRRRIGESVQQRKRAEAALRVAKVLTEAEWTSEKRLILRAAAVLIGDDILETVICTYYKR